MVECHQEYFLESTGQVLTLLGGQVCASLQLVYLLYCNILQRNPQRVPSVWYLPMQSEDHWNLTYLVIDYEKDWVDYFLEFVEAILTPISTKKQSVLLCFLVDIIPLNHFQSAYFREVVGFFRGDYIEVFYNRQRLHSTNGYMSPVNYELKMLEYQTAA